MPFFELQAPKSCPAGIQGLLLHAEYDALLICLRHLTKEQSTSTPVAGCMHHYHPAFTLYSAQFESSLVTAPAYICHFRPTLLHTERKRPGLP